MLIPLVLLTCFLTACSKKEEEPPAEQQEESVKPSEQPPAEPQEEGVKPSEQPPAEPQEEAPVEQPPQPVEQPPAQPSEQPPAQPEQAPTGQTGDKNESSLPQAKQVYEAKLESRLSEYDNKVNELKNRVASVTGDAKSEMSKAFAELTTHREEVEKKVDQLKAASTDSWETHGIDFAVDTLEKSSDQASLPV
jgi:hypothetical protein